MTQVDIKSPHTGPEVSGLSPIKIASFHSKELFLRWMEGQTFCWPDKLIQELILAEGTPVAGVEYKNRHVNLKRPSRKGLLPIDRYIATLRGHGLYTDTPPASSLMPFSYQRVPQVVRWVTASLVTRFNHWRMRGQLSFPRWPLDLSVDALSDLSSCLDSRHLPRQNQSKSTVVLTHDIDNPESLRNMPQFLAVEESFGLRSTNFIVPLGWPLDHAIIERAVSEGHEIGLHGYNHDNRTPFLPYPAIERRFEECLPFVERYRVKGYRAPSLLRTQDLFRCLKQYGLYDATVPTVGGPYSTKPNGCASARPFYQEGLWELPLSLPTDANLIFMGFKPESILRLWIDTTRAIHHSGGTVVLLTHCEGVYSGNPEMLRIYTEFLTFLKSSGLFEIKTAREVKELWNGYCPER